MQRRNIFHCFKHSSSCSTRARARLRPCSARNAAVLFWPDSLNQITFYNRSWQRFFLACLQIYEFTIMTEHKHDPLTQFLCSRRTDVLFKMCSNKIEYILRIPLKQTNKSFIFNTVKFRLGPWMSTNQYSLRWASSIQY